MTAPLPTDERAFPSPYSLPESVGLTKRELFAAMAMQGLLACDRYGDTKCAEMALAHADALLAALDRTQEKSDGR